MNALISPCVVAVCAILAMSCAGTPGAAAMGGVREGMSREQVGAVMQSHGLRPDDSRKRPSGGWKTYGQDPFAAGSAAHEFEQRSGHRVEWAEVYHVPSDTGASVINLYYDGSGNLVR